MKLSTSFFLLHSCAAFAPPEAKASFGVISSKGYVSVPLSMAEETPDDERSIEEMAKIDADETILKEKRAAKFKTKAGVEYAPWLKMDAEKEAETRQIAKEKAAIRAKQAQREKELSGTLYFDSQSQELGGAGLNSKIIDGDVELTWVTKKETNTQGYILKRRAAKTEDFVTVADYKSWGPLVSKGDEGGVYSFLDTTTNAGGYIYRVTEVDDMGIESDLSQCLVEIQTQEEQRNTAIAAIGIGLVAVSAVVAGLVLDPYAG